MARKWLLATNKKQKLNLNSSYSGNHKTIFKSRTSSIMGGTVKDILHSRKSGLFAVLPPPLCALDDFLCSSVYNHPAKLLM